MQQNTLLTPHFTKKPVLIQKNLIFFESKKTSIGWKVKLFELRAWKKILNSIQTSNTISY